MDQRDAVLIAMATWSVPIGWMTAISRRYDAAANSFTKRVGDALSAVHVLPFFPCSSRQTAFRSSTTARWTRGWVADRTSRSSARRPADGGSGHRRDLRPELIGFVPIERQAPTTYFIEMNRTPTSAPSRARAPRHCCAGAAPSMASATSGAPSATTRSTSFFESGRAVRDLNVFLLLYVHNSTQIVLSTPLLPCGRKLRTSCMPCAATTVVKLLRDVLEMLQPGLVLLTATNVPHEERQAVRRRR